jgi:hypothetical protein
VFYLTVTVGREQVLTEPVVPKFRVTRQRKHNCTAHSKHYYRDNIKEVDVGWVRGMHGVEHENAYKILLGNLKRKYHLGNLGLFHSLLFSLFKDAVSNTDYTASSD